MDRFSVISTEPLSAKSIMRLKNFFQLRFVEFAEVAKAPHLHEAMVDCDGVITNAGLKLDAEVVEQLPKIKAVALMDSAPHQIALDVLTQRGARATQIQGKDQLQKDQLAAAVWARINQHVAQHAAPSAFSRWGKGVGLGVVQHNIRLRFVGLPNALAFLLDAGYAGRYQVEQAERAIANERTPSFWVQATASACADGAALTQVIDIQDLIQSFGADMAMEEGMQEALMVDDFIASFGFGRNGWHPKHLLNPDVSCLSCC